MKLKNWRKLATLLHREIGYFFVGMTVVYAISGIALNHRNDWNPSFIVHRQEIETTFGEDHSKITTAAIKKCLADNKLNDPYRGHDFPSQSKLKIFTKKGSLFVHLDTGKGEYEALKRRAVFYQVNFLHTDSRTAWIVFSDIFCVGLLIIAITGTVMRKGRHGMKGRGGWLVAAGIAAPIIFLLAL